MTPLSPHTDHPDLPELLQKVARGDSHAFKRLVDLYWERIYRNILVLARNTEKAQEITQDILLTLWEQRTQLAEIDNFMGYVYRIGSRQVISAMRKKMLETESLVREDLAETRNLPELQLEYKETWQLIMQAIDQMPPKQQQVFRMSRIDGLSHEEIAQTLGVTVAAVKWHVSAGLANIRLHLSRYGGDKLFLYLLLADISLAL